MVKLIPFKRENIPTVVRRFGDSKYDKVLDEFVVGLDDVMKVVLSKDEKIKTVYGALRVRMKKNPDAYAGIDVQKISNEIYILRKKIEIVEDKSKK